MLIFDPCEKSPPFSASGISLEIIEKFGRDLVKTAIHFPNDADAETRSNPVVWAA
jgi:hypothetical protein